MFALYYAFLKKSITRHYGEKSKNEGANDLFQEYVNGSMPRKGGEEGVGGANTLCHEYIYICNRQRTQKIKGEKPKTLRNV